MSDLNENFKHRIADIHGSLDDLSKAITANEEQQAARAATDIAGIFLVTITEISHSLAQLVEISNRDYEAAVKAEADNAANEKRKEEAKRSYIGQKK